MGLFGCATGYRKVFSFSFFLRLSRIFETFPFQAGSLVDASPFLFPPCPLLSFSYVLSSFCMTSFLICFNLLISLCFGVFLLAVPYLKIGYDRFHSYRIIIYDLPITFEALSLVLHTKDQNKFLEIYLRPSSSKM